MKALIVKNYNGPDAIEYKDVETPTLESNQVQIEVHYSGVGLVDILFSKGFGEVKLPFIPGLEVSGIITSTGDDVHNFKVGDRVAAHTINKMKGHSQFVNIREDFVVHLPDDLPLEIAAGALTNTTTAVILLKEIVKLKPGSTVLIYGAAGGLGSQIGELAKLLGASKVVGVVSNKNKQVHSEQLSFDEVILKSGFLSSSEEKYDIIIDPIGGVQRSKNITRLKPYGTLAIVGNASQEKFADIDPDLLWYNNSKLVGFNFGMYTAHYPSQVKEYTSWILHLILKQKITLPILHIEPIKNAVDALSKLESGAINGKLVLEH